MRHSWLYVLSTLLIIAGCTSKTVTTSTDQGKIHPKWAIGATIYEMNIRQLTPQGTFWAATEELPRLDEIGVDIISVMPIQPIGTLNRQGVLGSPYSISNLTGFNAEFGNQEDFEAFVDRAHQLGMHVILEWAAGQTSIDHPWTKNKEWYLYDSIGNLCTEVTSTDIAKLDYSNHDMRSAMISAMRFWVDSIGIDGFKCKNTALAPIDFWDTAVEKLQRSNPDLFFLCDAENPELTHKAFDAYCAEELCQIMNSLSQGKIRADSLERHLIKVAQHYPQSALQLNYTSSEKENSQTGTAAQRLGPASWQMTVLSYLLPGIPLIYNGQETENNRQLRQFDKDTIQRVIGAQRTLLYRSLNEFRDNHPALNVGSLIILQNNQPDKILAIQRSEGNDRVIGVFNFSAEVVTVKIDATDKHMSTIPNGVIQRPSDKLRLEPYECLIFYN